MNNYKEFQFATIVFVFAIPGQILLVFLFATQAGSSPMSFTSLALANGVFVIIYLLFYGMTTTIDQKFIRITYGIGLIRKSIKLDDIKAVSIVSNPWYYGWGIRFIPNGMLYNINGSAGVELAFRHRPGVIRIGSAKPPFLQRKILSLIKE